MQIGDKMIPETQPCILPYTFHHLPNDRVLIIHPSGARLCKTKSQIETILREGYPERPLTSHETIMLEDALKALEQPITWLKKEK